MRYTITTTPYALQQTIDCMRYLELQEVGLGERFLNSIEVLEQFLSNFPEAGESVAHCNERLGLVRKFPLYHFPHHLVLYQVNKNASEVTILVVSHQARNIQPILDRITP